MIYDMDDIYITYELHLLLLQDGSPAWCLKEAPV